MGGFVEKKYGRSSFPQSTTYDRPASANSCGVRVNSPKSWLIQPFGRAPVNSAMPRTVFAISARSWSSDRLLRSFASQICCVQQTRSRVA